MYRTKNIRSNTEDRLLIFSKQIVYQFAQTNAVYRFLNMPPVISHFLVSNYKFYFVISLLFSPVHCRDIQSGVNTR